MPHASLPPDTLRLVAAHPDLSEQHRQATVNFQVADLLDVRASTARTLEQAAAYRRRAADRRELGERLLQQLQDRVAAARKAEPAGLVPTSR